MLESLSADWIVETEKQAMQEDVEILYNEIEQFYGDENDQYENESKCSDKRETWRVGHIGWCSWTFKVNPFADDLDFLDDDLTD